MKRRPGDYRQHNLFEVAAPPADGSLNFDAELRALLSEAIASSGKSREEIAARMERLLGSDPNYPVSRATLDAWTAPSRTDWRFPLLYLPAFIIATGAHELLEAIARRCGRLVVTDEERDDIELGRVTKQLHQLQARARELKTRRGRA